nr:MAG TPA: hypothetical protein [Caudoviricetes sp.]
MRKRQTVFTGSAVFFSVKSSEFFVLCLVGKRAGEARKRILSDSSSDLPEQATCLSMSAHPDGKAEKS